MDLFNHKSISNMIKSTLLFLSLLCLANTSLLAQHYQININSPTDPPLEGNYKYKWTPTSECDFGIEASGPIAVKWECVDGLVSSVTLDFGGLEFSSTNPQYSLSYGTSWVNAWHGPNGANWNPAAPFYDIDLLKLTPVQVSNLSMGESITLSIGFSIEGINDQSGELPRYQVCDGRLTLAPFTLNCPLCVDPMPDANFVVSDVNTYSPGPNFAHETQYELTDVSTPANHEREWSVLYYRGMNAKDENGLPLSPWWTEVFTTPVITAIEGETWAGGHKFQKIISVTLKVWNCTGSDTKWVHGSQLPGMAPDRSNNGNEASLNQGTAAELYPNMVKSGDEFHIMLPNLGLTTQAGASVLDINGRTIFHQLLQNGDNIVSTTGIAPGMYMVQIMDGKKLLSQQKLIVL